jgi:hypothetical protein
MDNIKVACAIPERTDAGFSFLANQHSNKANSSVLCDCTNLVAFVATRTAARESGRLISRPHAQTKHAMVNGTQEMKQ